MLKFSGKKPDHIGPVPSKLHKCSWKPNCVCSQYEEDKEHYVAPLALAQPVELVWDKLQKIVRQDPSAKIQQVEQFYMHAEFSTRVMGFVDDVEFLGIPGERVIHVRSASRLGVRDFGVNRNRIEAIRARLITASPDI